ncbi:integrase catalytic domain-containing protein [Trichonephila inaurata madagascariensis]|uniref:Integrase catalytic domain-containing protein n=1 Tax=Trichonephila inaurata madagascariensis TaxID=2747483 RepID=A0A8X6WLY5_9ARAC|nr:integrase catalytic domain-containing protein [Trichonephila inaurata madagascariensis]
MVTVFWLRDKGDWSVFVANRITEIKLLFPKSDWRHLRGNMNPADLISRGCTPCKFIESRWLEGPSWLLEPHPSHAWPLNELINCETSEILLERRKIRLCNLNLSEKEVPCSSPAPPRIFVTQDQDVATDNEDRDPNQSWFCVGILHLLRDCMRFRRQRQDSMVRNSSTFLKGSAEENQLVVIGPSEVGKTALVRQYIEGNFIETHHPTTEENHIHIIKTPEISCSEYKKLICLNELPSHVGATFVSGGDSCLFSV